MAEAGAFTPLGSYGLRKLLPLVLLTLRRFCQEQFDVNLRFGSRIHVLLRSKGDGDKWRETVAANGSQEPDLPTLAAVNETRPN